MRRAACLLALTFRVEISWCTEKWVKVWYTYILGSFGVHYRNISTITEGSTWASPCVSNLVCWIFIILMDVIYRAGPLCNELLVCFCMRLSFLVLFYFALFWSCWFWMRCQWWWLCFLRVSSLFLFSSCSTIWFFYLFLCFVVFFFSFFRVFGY